VNFKIQGPPPKEIKPVLTGYAGLRINKK